MPSTLDTNLRGTSNPTYSSWREMKKRCLLPTHTNYQRYGGRGITLDPSWENYDNFLRDMGPRPDGTTLDRVDNDAGYSKGNCRWATRKTQQNNRRNTRHVTWRGETHSAREWEHRLGFNKSTISMRLLHGWSVDSALTTPVREYTCRP